MKEEWEYLYLHQKAMRDAQLISQDIPIPKGEPYGQFTDKPEWRRRFNGPRFFAELLKLGHDNMNFERCKCHKR